MRYIGLLLLISLMLWAILFGGLDLVRQLVSQ